MPSTYAHRRIGEEVKKALPSAIGKTVEENGNCFALGLHGPDPLFYFKPLKSNAVNAEGYAMHNRPASEFFIRAREIYAARGRRECDAAFLFGFLCHFALDSECHPSVNAKIAQSGVTHTEIESAFDRFLLLKDGKDPIGIDLTSHISSDETLCEVAAAYFCITQKQAGRAIGSFKRYNKLFSSRSRMTRGMINLILKLSGNYREMHGMMLPLRDDERCADSNAVLSDCYENAVKKAVRLICNYRSFLDGEGLPGSELDRNYE